MEFTEAIPTFGGHVAISPDGAYIARIQRIDEFGFQLSIQFSTTLWNLATFQLPLHPDAQCQKKEPFSKHFPPKKPRKILPSDLELIWAPNSRKCLVACIQDGRIIIIDLDDETEGLFLQEMAGRMLARTFWSPDSSHIITVLEHQVVFSS